MATSRCAGFHPPVRLLVRALIIAPTLATDAPTREPSLAPTEYPTSPTPTTTDTVCLLPGELGEGIEGDWAEPHPCKAGLNLDVDNKCWVHCSNGYTALDTSASYRYTCFNRDFQRATLKCQKTGEFHCTLPKFSAGVVGKGCASEGTLLFGSSCTVECEGGYVAGEGTTEFACR